MAVEQSRSALAGLGLRVSDPDEGLAYGVGILRPSTRVRGLSPRDRACLAQARASGLPALTADRGWLSLDLGVMFEAIR
jgi:ribonuclease VapC